MENQMKIGIFIFAIAIVLIIVSKYSASDNPRNSAVKLNQEVDGATDGVDEEGDAPPKHNPGYDIYGKSLNSDHCRSGLDQNGIVDKENDLWRFQIYTVQPSMTNLKYQNVQM